MIYLVLGLVALGGLGAIILLANSRGKAQQAAKTSEGVSDIARKAQENAEKAAGLSDAELRARLLADRNE